MFKQNYMIFSCHKYGGTLKLALTWRRAAVRQERIDTRDKKMIHTFIHVLLYHYHDSIPPTIIIFKTTVNKKYKPHKYNNTTHSS